MRGMTWAKSCRAILSNRRRWKVQPSLEAFKIREIPELAFAAMSLFNRSLFTDSLTGDSLTYLQRFWADDGQLGSNTQVLVNAVTGNLILNVRLFGWSQWVDATLSSEPHCIEDKS